MFTESENFFGIFGFWSKALARFIRYGYFGFTITDIKHLSRTGISAIDVGKTVI
jgi:hypothetical protein